MFSTKAEDNDVIDGDCAERHQGDEQTKFSFLSFFFITSKSIWSKGACYNESPLCYLLYKQVMAWPIITGIIMFSTKDEDNDVDGGDCAERHQGAWWFGTCLTSNLHGLYYPESESTSIRDRGITWKQWKGDFRPLKTSEMKIRPN